MIFQVKIKILENKKIFKFKSNYFNLLNKKIININIITNFTYKNNNNFKIVILKKRINKGFFYINIF